MDKHRKLIEKIIGKQKSLYVFSRLGKNRKRFGVEFSLLKFGHPKTVKRFSKELAQEIRRTLGKKTLSRTNWVITAPPSTLTHPADLLADDLSSSLRLPRTKMVKSKPTVDYSLLRKTHERRQMVKEIRWWIPRPRTVRGKNVILVDDAIVTGHTLREVTRALLKAGAHEVHIFNVLHLDHKDPSLEGRLNQEAVPDRLDLVLKLMNAGGPVASKALLRLSATNPKLFKTVIKKIHKKGRTRMLKHFSRYAVREEHASTALSVAFLRSLLAH